MHRRQGAVVARVSPASGHGARVAWLLAYAVIVAVWSLPPAASDESCPREESRLALASVRKRLLPLAESLGVEVPEACPLHPDRDRYREHEIHTLEIRSTMWQCKVCNKKFRSHSYLDQHFDRRHSELTDEEGTCFADYCGVVGCGDADGNAVTWSRTDTGGAGSDGSHEDAFYCEVVFHKCWPPSRSESFRRVHDAMTREFCGASGGGRGASSVWATVWVVITAVAIVGILVFYFVMWSVKR